uniref:Uncharacterized protein n=1 Tax=Lepeophtheirus salmonis TaxID=72036 RepID=A0A0K2U9M1_LEPSM
MLIIAKKRSEILHHLVCLRTD